MLIIAGHLVVDPNQRDAYVTECVPAVNAARVAPGCLDFSITADSVDPARIRIFERWDDEQQLLAFRGSGPSDDQQTAIVDADVKRYDVASVGDPELEPPRSRPQQRKVDGTLTILVRMV
jgi:quinol monooxygenase YgiN